MTAQKRHAQNVDPDALTILNTIMNAMTLVGSFAVIVQQVSKDHKYQAEATDDARDAMVKHLGILEELIGGLSADLDALEHLRNHDRAIRATEPHPQIIGALALSLDSKTYEEFAQTHHRAAQRTVRLIENVYPAIRLLHQVHFNLGEDAKQHLVELNKRVNSYLSRGTSFEEGMNNAHDVINVARSLMQEMRSEIQVSLYPGEDHLPRI